MIEKRIEVDTGYTFPEVLIFQTETVQEMIDLIDNIQVIKYDNKWQSTIKVPDPYIISCDRRKHYTRKFNPKTDTKAVGEC